MPNIKPLQPIEMQALPMKPEEGAPSVAQPQAAIPVVDTNSPAASAPPLPNPAVEQAFPLDTEIYAGNHQAEQLSGKIKEKWNELSDEDVTAYHSQPDHFYTRLNEKYGLSREQADIHLAGMHMPVVPPVVVPVTPPVEENV